MHQRIPRLVALGAAFAGVVALVALALTMGGGSGTTTTLAATTPDAYDCATPDALGKPCPDGNLSGVADIVVPSGSFYIYMCIARNDHDSASDLMKIAVVCVTDSDAFGTSDTPDIDIPGEGADGVLGPPPPPGYSVLPVNKGIGKFVTGSWTPSDDGYTDTDTYNCQSGSTNCIITITCFPRLGASVLGNNNIAVTMIPDPKTQMGSQGFQDGKLQLVTGATNADCDAYDGPGHTDDWTADGDIESHPSDDKDALCAGSCDQVSYRPGTRAADGNMDYDGDGCSDFQELDKTDLFKCGDDPWNPLDTDASDVSGNYSILTEALRADSATAGAYFACNAVLSQTGDGKTDGDVTARLYCYTDNPAVVVNPNDAADCTDPDDCGDGFPGGQPPFPFGDMDDKHTELTGRINNTDNTIELRGCFDGDADASPIIGHAYVESAINAHTGNGTVDIWLQQDIGDCTTGAAHGSYSGVGGAPTFPDALIFAGKQEPLTGGDPRDSDQDHCSDAKELGDDPAAGGLRDPGNPYDFYDVNGDGQVSLTLDILPVLVRWTPNPSQPYDAIYDRGAQVAGANSWNKYGPDGQISLTFDILGVILQWLHTCN